MDAQLEALATALGERLLTRGWRLAVAESCTGGWVAQTITAIAGSSAWFEAGVIAYSNASKTALLGVTASTLAHAGAVSEATAREMAAGVLACTGADLSLAITGIAGPAGGSPGKPVGTVCFAWARRNREPESATRRFVGDREAVRRQAVLHALQGALGQAHAEK
jgi:nicotinamide-nucleotide amidase